MRLSRAGALAAALGLLHDCWSTDARAEAAGDEAAGAEAAVASPQGALQRSLLRLIVCLCRAWSEPSDLRRMLVGASTDAADAADAAGTATGTAAAAAVDSTAMRWLALLLAATRPIGPSLPYVALRAPGRAQHAAPSHNAQHGAALPMSLPMAVPERAWPPAQAYSACCWVRRPAVLRGGRDGHAAAASVAEEATAAAAVAEGAESPFALFQFETTDGRSRVAALLTASGSSGATLTLQSGSSLKRVSKRLPLPTACDGRWHHIGLVHERRRPLHTSLLTVHLDGAPLLRGTFAYPPFDCCHSLEAHLGYCAADEPALDAPPRPPPGPPPPPGASGLLPPALPGSGGAGWHLGPTFVAEGLLSEAQVREIASGCFWLLLIASGCF